MRYFFIMGNLTSIAGFVALVYQNIKTDTQVGLSYWLIFIILFLSICFWIYFYLRPLNPISKKISANLDYTGRYTNSNNPHIDIIEGDVMLDILAWQKIISLPPFEDIPNVEIIRANKEGEHNLPEICDISNDSFKIKIHSANLGGQWRWRARGKILIPIK
jgi:hypothetical protein